MKRHILELFTLAAALALTAGCSRIEIPDPGSGEGIVFSPEQASTKGLLDAANLAQTGTKIQVYDYITGFDGKVGNTTVSASQTVKYFSDLISYDSGVSTYWPYWNSSTGAPDVTIAYPWTKKGTHTFFGWLDTDGTASGLSTTTLFGANQPSLNESTRVLSIPMTTMGTATPQFDFSYSGVESVNAATRTAGTAVPMELQHLFTAFKLTVTNTSGNSILLKSVTLTGMKNSRSATIDFSAAPPTVATVVGTSSPVTLYTYTPGAGEDPYGHEFIYYDAELDELMPGAFLLMWPQTYAELDGATLDVVYKVRTFTNEEHTQYNDSDELTANVVLTNQNVFKQNRTGMDAGTKYVFNLQFKKSTLDIYTTILPWEYEAYDWDYSDHSISARSGMFKDGVLAFYRYSVQDDAYTVTPTTDEWSAKAMRFNSRSEVMKGRFYIESPREGRWQVIASPLSAAQYFVITPTSGDIDAYTDNGKCEFTVSVNPDLSPQSTQNLYFSVQLFFNGEWHDANSEFNRKNIRLVLDAN